MTAQLPDPIDRRVGSRLRSLRLARGIPSLTLDLAVGMPAGSTDRFETGYRSIAASQLVRISLALGVEPEYFFQAPGRAIDHDDVPSVELDAREFYEARRFVAAFTSLTNPEVRSKFMELVRTLADAAAEDQPTENSIFGE